MVLPVGVAAEVPGEPLPPARALGAGQEMTRNPREQLQGETKRLKKAKEKKRLLENTVKHTNICRIIIQDCVSSCNSYLQLHITFTKRHTLLLQL